MSSNTKGKLKLASIPAGSDLENETKEHKKVKAMRKRLMSYFINSSVVIIIFLSLYLYRSDINKPSSLPKIFSNMNLNSTHRDLHLWGTYRPGVYFGICPRISRETYFDFMWFKQPKTVNEPVKLRHECSDDDDLRSYMWSEHDGNNYGRQILIDGEMKLETIFIKGPTDDGLSWSVRVKGDLLEGSPDKLEVYSLIFSFYHGYGGGIIWSIYNEHKELEAIMSRMLNIGMISITATNKNTTGDFSSHYYASESAHPSKVTNIIKDNLVRQKNMKILSLPDTEFIPNRVDEKGFIAMQITSRLPFEVDLQMLPCVFKYENISQLKSEGRLRDREALNAAILDREEAFNSDFESKFQLRYKDFSDEQIKFGKYALSSLLGGIGYFYGRSLVMSESHDKPINYLMGRLTSGTPARAKFPRGFLWDEGFHLLVVNYWDSCLTVEILGSWLDLMNKDGWIPREQILGREAQYRVPEEFIIQHDDIANPPTFLLTLHSILTIREVIYDATEIDSFLEKAYPRIKNWFEWLRTTLTGPVTNTFQWKGRDAKTISELNPKTLASGLDDSPRASHPSPDEKHIDILCWIAFGAEVMSKIATQVDMNEDATSYRELHKALSNLEHLKKHHWDSNLQQFSDYGLHTSDVVLVPNERSEHGERLIFTRKVNSSPNKKLVNHFGYINLFPMLLRLLPSDSDELRIILDKLDNPRLLWTQYGLRSLSASDPIYNKQNTPTDAPYWRGAIWVNINYMCLQALYYYSHETGPNQKKAKELYSKLRENLITNIFNQYKATGYFWEQYRDTNGAGMGAHPFNGWTSLILLVMAEKY